MKIKVKNKVIDLSLVEEITTDGHSFNILYSNGRNLEFIPERVKAEAIFKGNPSELQRFLGVKIDNSTGEITHQNIKEHFRASKSSVEGGYQMFEVFNIKEENEAFKEQVKVLEDLYKKVQENWEHYVGKNVTIV